MAKSATRQKSKTLPPGVRKETSRTIKQAVESMLWGRAAGRCGFTGCNKILSRSSVTQEQVNTSQKAHIYSFKAAGPRGHEKITDEELNDVGNLILVCHECHRKIDQHLDGGRYQASLLRQMKASHERRIEIVTGIDPGRQGHVLFYGANIGEHSSPFEFNEAAAAMFPDRYPAEAAPIILGITDSSLQDRLPDFWPSEARQLATRFEQRVRERVAQRDIDHLSLFALAPQPLLVLLGTLLGDIVPADVYQRHREPSTWSWPTAASPLTFEVREPESFDGPPALVLALSATVTPDRIQSVLGSQVSIWTVSVPQPGNDIIKSREHLAQLRRVLRGLFDRIKAVHGQTTTLHVFPVASVSAAVEFGRARMPKADMPWCIYDQSNQLGGFVPTISVPLGDR